MCQSVDTGKSYRRKTNPLSTAAAAPASPSSSLKLLEKLSFSLTLVCIETSLFVPPDDFVLFQQPPPGRGKNCLGLHTRAAPGIGIVLSRGLFLAVPEPEAPIRFLVDDKYLQIAHPTLLSSSFWRDGISSVVAASSGRAGVGALWWSFWCRERTLLSGVKYNGGFSNGSL